jgi:hypothetical protein
VREHNNEAFGLKKLCSNGVTRCTWERGERGKTEETR